MKNIMKTLALALLLSFGSFAFGQTFLTNTTFSAAVTSTRATQVQVTSATGITATNVMLYIDSEAMFVNSVNGTSIGVTRGYFGTVARTHDTNSLVWLGTPNFFAQNAQINEPSGTCTRANLLFLPNINTKTGIVSDCLGGVWVNGVSAKVQTTPAVVLNAATGGTIYTSINGTGTAPGATTEMYCSELFLPFNKQLTGMAVLNGTSVATDAHQYELYDATGNLLAKTASTAAGSYGSASEYGQVAFATKYYAVGPAKYYTCFTSNGTTATVRMLVTQVNDFLTAGKLTGLVYGTVPTKITVPTTFTTALGPYSYLY